MYELQNAKAVLDNAQIDKFPISVYSYFVEVRKGGQLMTWITASLGPKGQVTLPKRIREALGAKEPGDVIGFLLDEKSGSVKLTRMEIRPAGEEYTEEDLRKLLKLAKERGGKKFSSAEDFLRHIDKL